MAELGRGAPSLRQVAHGVWFEVLQLVTRLTERQAIVNVEPQLGVIRKRFDVVRMEICAACVTTAPARVSIARKDRGAPRNILGATPDRMVKRRHTSLPAFIGWPLRCAESRCAGPHHGPLSGCLDVAYGKLIADALARHQPSRFRCMATALKTRWCALLEERLGSNLYTVARKAASFLPIATASIVRKLRFLFPAFTDSTAFQAFRKLLEIFIQRHTDISSGSLQSTFEVSSHVSE